MLRDDAEHLKELCDAVGIGATKESHDSYPWAFGAGSSCRAQAANQQPDER